MSFLKKHGLFAAVLFLFLVHLSYLPNGFVWLDHGDIEQGRVVVPLSRLPEALLHRYGETGFYRPLVTAVTSVDAAVYDKWAPGYHVTNVIIHLGVAVAAGYFLACFFSLKEWERVMVTLLVGVAPVSFIPVGVISYRQELLYVLCTLLTVILFAKRKYWYASLMFLAAIFSKETALVIVPALLFLWEITRGDYAKYDREIHNRVKRFLGMGVLLVIYIFLRRIAVPEHWHISPVELPIAEGIGTRLWALGRLGMQLISPLLLRFSDATPVISITHPVSLFVLLFVLIAVGIVWKYGVWSSIGVWLGVLAIMLVPAFNIVPLPRFSSPHYGYMASVIIAVAPLLLLRLAQRRAMKYLLIGGMVLWFLVAAYSTYTAGFRLFDDRRLFLPEVHADENFREGFSFLGDEAFFSGQADQALQWYEAALVEKPGIIAYVDRTSVINNTAGILLAHNRMEEAATLLAQIPLQGDSSSLLSIRYNRALIAYKLGRFQEAVTLLHGNYPWTRKEPGLLLLEAERQLKAK